MKNVIIIYDYLIQGFSQSWIVKHKKIDKGYVSRCTNQLVKDGYLKLDSGNSKPKFYRSTGANIYKCKKSTKPVFIRIHKLGYIFHFVSDPKRKVKWDKISDLKNGVIQKYIYWKSEIGKTTIRLQICPDKDKNNIVIWLPSKKILEEDKDKYGKILESYALKASAWLQKLLQCQLTLPEIYQKPHFAVDIKEPFMIDAVEHGATFSAGEIMMDKSPPRCIPEFESTNPELVSIYMNLPNEIKSLNTRVDKHDMMIETMSESLKLLIDNQKILTYNMDKILKMLQMSNSKPDERIDVA